jgi:hypothetical protein
MGLRAEKPRGRPSGNPRAGLEDLSYTPWSMLQVGPGPWYWTGMDQAHAIEQDELPDGLQTPPHLIEASERLKPFQFTADNAREMALRSAESRRAAAASPEAVLRAGQARVSAETADRYVAKRIVQVRRQIEGLNERLEAAVDPKDIKALCDAISKLAELERVLAGRPLPGQRRPGKDAPARRPATVLPLE